MAQPAPIELPKQPAPLELPKQPPAGAGQGGDKLNLLDIYNEKRNPFGSFGLKEAPPNQKEFEQTQKFVSGNPQIAGAITIMNMMPFAEKEGVKSWLTDQSDELWALESSAKSNKLPIAPMRAMSTIQCHQPQKTYEPPPPTPYNVGDLRAPAATKEIADGLTKHAISFGDFYLKTPAEKAAFKTAIEDINKRADISVSDRSNIMAGLCAMMWPGKNRPFSDETCRALAVGLAQSIAHPPEGATGDLKLAQTDPRRLTDYVRNMAVRGTAQYADKDQRQLTEEGKKSVCDAKTPQEKVDRLLGATRTVIPTQLEVDLRKLDDAKDANAANFPMSDQVKKVLKEIHDADKRIQTISISHQANGDDVIRIGLEAARTEGEGLTAITFAKTLNMTVHRNGDGSVELKDLKGISTPLIDPEGLKLGKTGEPNRKIIAVTWIKDRNVTSEIPAAQIEQFDQMIRVLDDLNSQRKR